MIDRLRYDILPKTHLLTMPVLLVVWDQDTSAPVVHQQTLYHNLPGLKELHIIPDAPHTFRAQEHFDQLYQILSTWIQWLQR
jgi:pimeloyl-ACP methyl ester carboxylesterase